MKFIIIIPARYASTRFPGKPLAEINGRPMIWWTYQEAKKVNNVSEVIVATDDKRILQKCNELGINCEMTSDYCKTSTERAYEIAKRHNSDLYVVVNGDEPLIDYHIIEKIIPNRCPNNAVYNLMTPIHDPVQALDPSNIKVVIDENCYALMFSRSLIPYPKSSISYSFYKHVGVLAYTLSSLEFFVETKKGKLEEIEDINELRFLEHGVPVKMVLVDCNSLSVDTPKDLDYIAHLLKEK